LTVILLDTDNDWYAIPRYTKGGPSLVAFTIATQTYLSEVLRWITVVEQSDLLQATETEDLGEAFSHTAPYLVQIVIASDKRKVNGKRQRGGSSVGDWFAPVMPNAAMARERTEGTLNFQRVNGRQDHKCQAVFSNIYASKSFTSEELRGGILRISICLRDGENQGNRSLQRSLRSKPRITLSKGDPRSTDGLKR
jgi:hypothetical protein